MENDNINEHQKSHINIETRLTLVEDKVKVVDKFILKMDEFMVTMRDNYHRFTESIQKSNLTFIRWIVGLLITIFILASMGQYQALRVIQKDIHSLDKKIISMHNYTVDDKP